MNLILLEESLSSKDLIHMSFSLEEYRVIKHND